MEFTSLDERSALARPPARLPLSVGASIRLEHAPFPPRQAGESVAWYRRFCTYLLMYPVRSLGEIYRTEKRAHEQGGPPGRFNQVPLAWRSAYADQAWVARAEQWDQAEAERLRVILTEARERQRRQELEDAASLRKKALDMLQLPHVRKSVDGHTIFPANAAYYQSATRMLEVSSRLARLALAMNPDRPEVLPEDELDQAIEKELTRLAGLAPARAPALPARASERLLAQLEAPYDQE